MKKILNMFCLLLFVSNIAKAQTEKYQPPQPISPSKGQIFTSLESKKPIVFRWTPLIPKSAQDITYKVTVIEVRDGQTSTEAIKTATPLFEKEITNQNMVVANVGDFSKVWRIDASSNYAWYVTAYTNKGVTIGENNGRGELHDFRLATEREDQQLLIAAGANAEFKIDTIYCVGEVSSGIIKYHIKATYKNLASSTSNILINDLGAFPGNIQAPAGTGFNLQNNIRTKTSVYNPALTISNIVEATIGTISGITPAANTFPSFLAPNTALTFEFDLSTSSNTSMIIFYGLVDDALKGATNKNSRNEVVAISTFPPCPACDYCKESMFVFNGTTSITDANNILTLGTNFSIPGINVTQFKAELIGVSYQPSNSNDQCWVCNKDDNQWGKFVNGTLSAPFSPTINGVFPTIPCCGGNSHHTIGWWGNAVVISGAGLRLNISLPPVSTLSCCPYRVSICIRYTFTDERCRSCSVVKCYDYTRNPQQPVIIWDDTQADSQIITNPIK
jgi:hypothetical protein